MIYAMERKNKKKQAVLSCFTLIELITVIVIMAFIMAIGIPAFSGMFKGQAIGNSTATVAQLLKLSRNYAIANHAYVAVIIPQKGYPSTGLPDSYYNTALRPALVKYESGNKPFKLYKWIDGESWTLLQPGTAILEYDDDNTEVKGSPKIGYCPVVSDVDFSDIEQGGGAKKVSNVSAVIFKYDGTAFSKNENNFTIDVGQGIITPKGLKIISKGKPIQIEISTETGMIFIDR